MRYNDYGDIKIVVDNKLVNQRTGKTITASAWTSKKEIHINENEVKRRYESGRISSIPKEEGIISIPEDTYGSYEDAYNFILEHEKMHFTMNRELGLIAKVDKENLINYLALRALNFKVPDKLIEFVNNYKYNKPTSVGSGSNLGNVLTGNIFKIAARYNVDVEKIRNIKVGTFDEVTTQLKALGIDKIYDQVPAFWILKNSFLHEQIGFDIRGNVVRSLVPKYRQNMYANKITDKFGVKIMMFNGKEIPGKKKKDWILTLRDIAKLVDNGIVDLSSVGEHKQHIFIDIPKNIAKMSNERLDKEMSKQIYANAVKSLENFTGNKYNLYKVILTRKMFLDEVFGKDVVNKELLSNGAELIKRVKLMFTPHKSLDGMLNGKMRVLILDDIDVKSMFPKSRFDSISFLHPNKFDRWMDTLKIWSDFPIRVLKPIVYHKVGNSVFLLKTSFQGPSAEFVEFMNANGIDLIVTKSALKISSSDYVSSKLKFNKDKKISSIGAQNIYDIPESAVGLLFGEKQLIDEHPSISMQIGNYLVGDIERVKPVIDSFSNIYIEPAIKKYKEFINKHKEDPGFLREWIRDKMIKEDMTESDEIEQEMEVNWGDYLKYIRTGGNSLADNKFGDITRNIIKRYFIGEITKPLGFGNRSYASSDVFGKLDKYDRPVVIASWADGRYGGVKLGQKVLVLKSPVGKSEGVVLAEVVGFHERDRGNVFTLNSKIFVKELGNDFDIDDASIITNVPKEMLDYYKNNKIRSTREVGVKDLLPKFDYLDINAQQKFLTDVRKAKDEVGFVSSFMRQVSIFRNGKLTFTMPDGTVYTTKNLTDKDVSEILTDAGDILQHNVDVLKVGYMPFNKSEFIRRLFGGNIKPEHFNTISNVLDNVNRTIAMFASDRDFEGNPLEHTLSAYNQKSRVYNGIKALLQNGEKGQNDINIFSLFCSEQERKNVINSYNQFSQSPTSGRTEQIKQNIENFRNKTLKIEFDFGNSMAEIPTSKLYTEVGEPFTVTGAEKLSGDTKIIDPGIQTFDIRSAKTAFRETFEKLVILSSKRKAVSNLKDTIILTDSDGNLSHEQIKSDIDATVNDLKDLWRVYDWFGSKWSPKYKESKQEVIVRIVENLEKEEGSVVRGLQLDSDSFAEWWKERVNLYLDRTVEIFGKDALRYAELSLLEPGIREFNDEQIDKWGEIGAYQDVPHSAILLIRDETLRDYFKVQDNVLNEIKNGNLYYKELLKEKWVPKRLRKVSPIVIGKDVTKGNIKFQGGFPAGGLVKYGNETSRQTTEINKYLTDSRLNSQLEQICKSSTGKSLSKLTEQSAVPFIRRLREINNAGDSGIHRVLKSPFGWILKNFSLTPETIKNAWLTVVNTPFGTKTTMEHIIEQTYNANDTRNSITSMLKSMLMHGKYFSLPKSVEMMKQARDKTVDLLVTTEDMLSSMKKNAILNGEKYVEDGTEYVRPKFSPKDMNRLQEEINKHKSDINFLSESIKKLEHKVEYEKKVQHLVGFDELYRKLGQEAYDKSMEKIARVLNSDLEYSKLTDLEKGVYNNAKYVYEFSEMLIDDFNNWLITNNIDKPQIGKIKTNYYSHMWETKELFIEAVERLIQKKVQTAKKLGRKEYEVQILENNLRKRLESYNKYKEPEGTELKTRFFANFLPRAFEELDGYSMNLEDVLYKYIDGISNKVTSDKLEFEINKTIDIMKSQVVNKDGKLLKESQENIDYAIQYRDDVLGRKRPFAKENPVFANKVDNISHALIVLAGHMYLGWRLASPLTNLTQIKNDYIDRGLRKTVRGLTGYKDPEIARAIDESGISEWIQKMELANLSPGRIREVQYHISKMLKGDWKQFNESFKKVSSIAAGLGMKPFGMSEMFNRKVAFATRYIEARDSGVGSHDDWVRLSTDFVRKTQFVYDNSNRAPFQRTAFGKLVSLYSTYSYNQLKFNAGLFKDVFEQMRTPGGGKLSNSDTREMLYKLARFIAINSILYGLAAYFSYGFYDRFGDEIGKLIRGCYRLVTAKDDKDMKDAMWDLKTTIPVGLPSGVLADAVTSVINNDYHNFWYYNFLPAGVRDIQRTIQTKDPFRYFGFWRTSNN